MSRRPHLIPALILALAAGFAVSGADAARFPSAIDLGNPFNARTVRIQGDDPGDRSGSALAGGDLNGDGFEDLAIGSHTALDGRGITHVVFGSLNFSAQDSLDLAAAPANTLRILGKSPLDWSGYSLACGNLNGDAWDDLVIGAWRADPGGRVNAGEVYVVFGSATLHTRGTIDLSGTPSGVLRIYGDRSDDGFGYSVAAGDVNGDTRDDLIAGAWHADPSGRTDAGRVFVIYGSAVLQNQTVIDLSGTPAGVTRISGEAAGDLAGSAVAMGDLNGDTLSEIIFGGSGAFGGKGAVYVLPGAAGIASQAAIDLASNPAGLVRLYGVAAGDGWGGVTTVGNLNGDGFSDLIFGAPYRDTLYRNDAGETAVFFGSAAFNSLGTVYLGAAPIENTIRVRGAEDMDGSGSSLAARDTDGDGRDELIIGAPGATRGSRMEAGAVYILKGAANLHLKGAIDLADTAQAVSRMDGAGAGGKTGSAVGAADLNHDGFADVAAGTPYADPVGRENAGETRVVFGFGSPAVIDYHPLENEAVNSSRAVTAAFNTDMVRVTLEVYDALAGLTDTLTTSGSALSYRFPQPFVAGSQVRAVLDAIDREGHAIPRKTWFFDVKPDSLPPRLRVRSPESGETLVSPAQNITITFSPDIRPDSTTVVIKGRNDRTIPMSRTWTDSTLMLVNSNSFQLSETVTVTISAADRYGDRTEYAWSFSTRPETVVPQCTVRVPGNPLLLNRDAWFRLFFPFDIDKATVEATLSGSQSGDISGTWVWADTTYTFTPATALRPGEALFLTVDAADIHKNTITGWTASFAVKPDEIPPELTAHSPAEGESNVNPSAPVILTFTSDVNRDSTTVVLTGKRQGTVGTSRAWLDYTLTLSHSGFALDDTVTVLVNAGDSYANRRTFTRSFAVRPETSAPTVNLVSPPNRNLMAAADSITLAFSADIDTASVALSLRGRLNETIPGTWRWTGTNFTFTPSQPYQAGNILTLVVNAADIHRNALTETTITMIIKPESTPPVILSHTPPAYAAGIPLTQIFTVRFNGDISRDSTTVAVRSDRVSSIPVTPTWADSTLTLTPSSPLRQNEAVTVALSASDRYGNRKAYAWTFTTGAEIAPPYSVALTLDPNLLPARTPIPVRVSRSVSPATVSATVTGSLSGAVAGAWAWSDTVYTFTPSPGYRPGETLTLRMSGKDIYGNSFPDFVRTFRVKLDEVPPAIRSRIPAAAESNVHPGESIVIVLTGDAVPDSTTVQVRGEGGRTIALTPSWRDSTLTLADPGGAFRLGETVAVTVRAGDIYANRAEHSWSFTVRPEITPPTFQVVTPSGTLPLRSTDPISLVFPADVDTARVSAVLTGSLSGAVRGLWTWSGTIRVFTPEPYRPGETLTLAVDAVDIHGNAIPRTTHTLMVRLDDIPPSVLSRIPDQGERYVDPGRSIVIVLSGDAVHDSTTVQVRGEGGRTVALTPSWRDSTLTLANPGGAFRLGETVTVTVRAGDAWANRAEYAWNFTIRSDIAPPVFQVEAPGDPAALAADAPLVLVFPADVDTASVTLAFSGSSSGSIATDRAWEGVRYTILPRALYRLGETLTLRATAADLQGNILPETVHTFTVGEHTPQLSITLAEPADSTGTVYRVRYVSADPDSNFTLTRAWQYSLDGGAWTAIPDGSIAGNTSRGSGAHDIRWTLPAAFAGVYSKNVRFRMEISDGRFSSGLRVSPPFAVDRNRAPSVAVRNISTDLAAGKTRVGYAISDAESNPVSLGLEYSLDGGVTWKPGATDSPAVNIPASGYAGQFAWVWTDSLRLGIDYYGVRIRLIPADYKPGTPGISEPFRVDRNIPPAATLDDIFTTQSGDVRLNWRITDAESDTVRFACSFSTDDGASWKPTANVTGADSLTTSSGVLTWHSGRDLPSVQSYAVRFRVVPSDHDPGTGDDTGSFQLFNNAAPQLAVVFPDTAGYRVSLPYTLTDAEGDRSDLRVSWSVDDGGVWHPASIVGSTAGLPSNSHRDTLFWDARADLGEGFFPRIRIGIAAGDSAHAIGSPGSVPAEGDFAVDNVPPRLRSLGGIADRDTVYVRFDEALDPVSALDAARYTLSGGLTVSRVLAENAPGSYRLVLGEGGKLPFAEITLTVEGLRDRYGNPAGRVEGVFHADDGNRNPSVTLEDLPAEVSGTVPVWFHASDAEEDTLSLAVSLSTDGGNTWRPASVEGDIASLGKGRYNDFFRWRSDSDLPGADIEGVKLRVTPRDSQEGEPAVSNPFRTDNNAPPTVSFAPFDPDSLRAGIVAIPYVLSDAEGDTLDLEAGFSTDNGATFRSMTLSDSPSGIPPARYAGSFRWDSSADLPDHFGTVLVRVSAADADPGGADTLAVALDNYGSCRVTVALPSGEVSGDAEVRYAITDPRSREVTLRARFSRDGGASWSSATLDGNYRQIGPAGYTGSCTWWSSVDLAGFEGTVLLEVIPDNGHTGVSALAGLRVDYNRTPSVAADPLPEEVGGDIPVAYTPSDPEGDPVLPILWYSIDSRRTWYRAALADTARVAANGSRRTVIWRSASDLPNRDTAGIWLRLAVADADTSGLVEIGPFRLDNNAPPTVALSLESPVLPEATAVELRRELSDPERNMLRFDLVYSLDGGGSWTPATTTGKTGSLFFSDYSGTVRWELATDLPDHSGEVLVKCLPWDADPGNPDSLAIRINTLGECRVAAAAPEDEQAGDIMVSYVLADPKGHALSLAAEFSVTGGASWAPATVTGKTAGIGPAEYSNALTWAGPVDLPGYSGAALFRITPNNGAPGIADTVRVLLDYNDPPIVIALENDPATILSGAVTLNVSASDAEADTFSVALEYSLDGGASYLPATVSGNTGISPASSGKAVWSSFADLGYAWGRTVHFRLRPFDSDSGTPFTAGPFTVTNLVGDFTHDLKVDGADLAGFTRAWKYRELDRETGPVSGTPPMLTVAPDGKLDFEDLAAFVWMWNWYTGQVTARGIPAVTSGDGEGSLPEESEIRFVPNGDGSVAVLSDRPPEYLRLLIDSPDAGGGRAVFEDGGRWAGDGRGIVLTRTYPGGVYEAAAALLESPAGADDASPLLGTLRVEGKGDLRIRYEFRVAGADGILTGTTVLRAEDIRPRPAAFALGRNTPNPFNPSTVIPFELPRDGHVRLTVRNLAGQKVTALHDGPLPAGYHRVRWNAGGFPSGVYFVTLDAPGFTETRKMTLVK